MVGTRRDELLRMLEHRQEEFQRRLDETGERGLKTRLRAIRRARKRLRSRTFGFCESCYLTIPWGELIAQPERTRCARCAPALEGALG